MVEEPNRILIGGYRLRGDRYYEAETHLWVSPETEDAARCGFDPLASETCGDIVAVSFEPAGTRIERGEPFGNLEAAKFVGPLLSPISGTLGEHNAAVVSNPGLLNSNPQEHWMIEIRPSNLEAELSRLLHDEPAVRAWFERDLERYREEGLLAE